MEILNTFGFNIQLFVAQIINFLILAFIFKKFLYKPILTVLNERKKKIEQGLKDAEKAHLAREKAEEERDEILKKTSREAEKILNDTKKAAEETRDMILADTKKEAEKLIADAKLQAQIESDRIRKETKSLSLDIANRILQNAIKDLFTKEEHEKIIKRGVKRIHEQNQ